jgi:hypothetical protein
MILIMKANEMHYFENLFDKVLYMFRKSPLSIIRSQEGTILTSLADSQHNQHDNYLLRVHSVQIFLAVDSGLVRNL